MKTMVCVAFAAMGAAVWAEERSFVDEYTMAMEIRDSKPDEAYDGLMRSYRLALAAGDENYAACAVLKACFIRHLQGRPVECGKTALAALPEIQSMVDETLPLGRERLGQLYGWVSSGFEAEGRLGEAWRMNRATAAVLRGSSGNVSGDPVPIRVSEIAGMPPMVRIFAWRTFEREAAFLNAVGRTLESKALLDEAAAVIKKRWPVLSGDERFYAFKVLCSRAMTMNFLGYESESIDEQRTLLGFGGSPGVSEGSFLILKANILVNRSKWEGPTEEMVEEMRGLDEDLKAEGTVDGVGRSLPKLEFRLKKSREAAAGIAKDAERKMSRNMRRELFFSDRDYLIARAELGDEELDGEYVRLLGELRAQGSKVSEPTIYREYGDYLLNGGRAEEAAGMYAEALRLTRGFGWFLHEPALLESLGEARIEAGDAAGAGEILEELAKWLANHGDAPVARRVTAQSALAGLHAKLGDAEAAAVARALAREWASNLPEWRKRYLLPSEPRTIATAAENTQVRNSPSEGAPRVRVSPISLVSVFEPDQPARGRFSVFNPGGGRVRGTWKGVGEGARLMDGGVCFEAGKPIASVAIPAELGAWESRIWFATYVPIKGGASATAQVSWVTEEENKGDDSTWEVRWNSSSNSSAVLDASGLRSNPFRHVTLFHELSRRAEVLGSAVPFRLKSPRPLRIEYYEPRSGNLLAVDANGNGNFTEAGDFHMGGGGSPASAMVPVDQSGPGLAVEIHLLSVVGEALPPSPSEPLVLVAEVFRRGSWSKESENVLE